MLLALCFTDFSYGMRLATRAFDTRKWATRSAGSAVTPHHWRRRGPIGRLDALTAACYGLKHEAYQAVLAAFKDESIPANEKKTRLEAFNDILLDGWPSVEETE